MPASARIDADRIDLLRQRAAEQPRRYFAPLANALRAAGAYDEAVSLLRTQLAAQPGHLTGHVILGQALFESGALAEAQEAFEAARALDPANRVVLRHLGEIASLRGDDAAARLWFERLRAADPYADDVAAQLGGAPTTPPEVDDGRGLAPPAGDLVVARSFEPIEFDPAPIADAAPVAASHGEAAATDARAVEAPDATSAAAHDDAASPADLLSVADEFEPFEFEPGLPVLDPVVGLDQAPADPVPPQLEAALPDEDGRTLDALVSGAFATETMARLLVAQGHTEQAVAVYERLVAERPDDAELRARLDALRGGGQSTAPAPTPDAVAGRAADGDVDDRSRGALLAAAFADLGLPVDGAASPVGAGAGVPSADDPFADLSFDRFFVAAAEPRNAAGGTPPHAPPPDAAAAAPAADDEDLVRFDAWLRGEAV